MCLPIFSFTSLGERSGSWKSVSQGLTAGLSRVPVSMCQGKAVESMVLGWAPYKLDFDWTF